MLEHTKRQVHNESFFYSMRCLTMFITAVCMLFLHKLTSLWLAVKRHFVCILLAFFNFYWVNYSCRLNLNQSIEFSGTLFFCKQTTILCLYVFLVSSMNSSIFSAAMLMSHRSTPTWRLHNGLCKFWLNIS